MRTPYHTPGQLLITIVASLWVSSPVLGADTTEEINSSRLRNGIYVGSNLTTGRLIYQSDTVESDISLTALPTLVAGFEIWPDDALGLHGEVQLGTGAQIKGVFEQTVAFNAMRFTTGGRYRWFGGPRAMNNAYEVGLGMQGYYQFVQDQRPSILLDRKVVGPRLSAAATIPILEGGTWVRLTAYGELPFFVRETPNDSGDPQSFLGYGAVADGVVPIYGPWSLQVNIEYTERVIEFQGPATRGAGTGDGKTKDRFIRFGISVRHTDI